MIVNPLRSGVNDCKNLQSEHGDLMSCGRDNTPGVACNGNAKLYFQKRLD